MDGPLQNFMLYHNGCFRSICKKKKNENKEKETQKSALPEQH